MQRILHLLAMVALLTGLTLTGCSDSKPALYIYTWADYIDPALLKQFEEEHDCRIIMDVFDSNESMYAKLQAGGGGYDVVFPSSYMALIMQDQGMLLPIDHDKLPHLAHIDRALHAKTTSDPEMAFSVPYMIGTTGIGYNPERTGEIEPSWAVFDRADFKGRISLLNDMRETLGAALKFLGYSINSTNETEIQEAADVVLRWKTNIAKFENEAYKPALASGEFILAQGYSGDILQVMEENEAIAYFVPREGSSIYADDMVILQGSARPDLAHAFINFLHSPEVAAQNMEFVYYLSPNLPAYDLVDSDLRNDPAVFLSPEILAKCETIRDLGEKNALYTAAWDRVKSGQ